MTSTKKTISEYTTEKLKSMEGSFVLGGEAYITKDAQVFKKSGDLWMPCREFATKGYRAVRLDDGHIYYVHKLFAEAFMEKPAGRVLLSFNDEDKTNISLDNLAYITQKELTAKNYARLKRSETYLIENGYRNVADGAYYINREGKCYSRNEDMMYCKGVISKQRKKVKACSLQGKPIRMDYYKIYATAFIDNPNNYTHLHFKTEGSTRLSDLEWICDKPKSAAALEKIAAEYHGYEKLDLTEQTKEFVRERLSGMMYERIAKNHGCTKQYVHQKLRAVRISLGTNERI